jgi:hypothetical protein
VRDVNDLLRYIDSRYDLKNSAKIVLDGNKVLGKDILPGIKVNIKEKKKRVLI